MTIARFSEDFRSYNAGRETSYNYNVVRETTRWIAVIGGGAAAFVAAVLLFVGSVRLGSLPEWSGHAGTAGLGIFGFIVTLLVEMVSFSIGVAVTDWLRRLAGIRES